MAESRSLPKTCAGSRPDEHPQTRRKPLEPRPTLPATRTPGRRYQPGEDQALAVESDLSEGMVIQEQELDAIAALLGGALDDLLAGP